MTWWEAIILGIIEGITEFLPVSSTGHLTIAEHLLGKDIADPGTVAFTAVIQIGAIAAAVIYFWRDIWRILKAWCAGLANSQRRSNLDYRFGWAIITGSIPIAAVGLLFKDHIESGLRSMWFVAAGLVGWSLVLAAADLYSRKPRRLRAGAPTGQAEPSDLVNQHLVNQQSHEVNHHPHDNQTTLMQALIIGAVQCFSLIPGVSRSGATISAGLFLGFDRVVATRLSFFLGIPALVAAGVLEFITQFDNIGATVGWIPTIIGLVLSFIVGYASIAWLLRFVSGHSFTGFIIYRVALGALIALLLITGVVPAT